MAPRAPSPAKEAANKAIRAAILTPIETIRDQVLMRIEPMEAVELGKSELTAS